MLATHSDVVNLAAWAMTPEIAERVIMNVCSPHQKDSDVRSAVLLGVASMLCLEYKLVPNPKLVPATLLKSWNLGVQDITELPANRAEANRSEANRAEANHALRGHEPGLMLSAL